MYLVAESNVTPPPHSRQASYFQCKVVESRVTLHPAVPSPMKALKTRTEERKGKKTRKKRKNWWNGKKTCGRNFKGKEKMKKTRNVKQ